MRGKLSTLLTSQLSVCVVVCQSVTFWWFSVVLADRILASVLGNSEKSIANNYKSNNLFDAINVGLWFIQTAMFNVIQSIRLVGQSNKLNELRSNHLIYVDLEHFSFSLYNFPKIYIYPNKDYSRGSNAHTLLMY